MTTMTTVDRMVKKREMGKRIYFRCRWGICYGIIYVLGYIYVQVPMNDGMTSWVNAKSIPQSIPSQRVASSTVWTFCYSTAVNCIA